MLGPPASGKHSIAALLCKESGVQKIDTADLLAVEIADCRTVSSNLEIENQLIN